MPRTYTGNVLSPFQEKIQENVTKDYSTDNLESQSYAFQPKYSQQQVEIWSQQYKGMPSIFSEETIREIEDHSQHYGMMFNRNLEDEEFRLFDVIKQAGMGWVSGFTTLEIGEQPKNEWEGIGRSLGHLGGFIGVIPGVGTAAKYSSSAILKGLAGLQGKSIPMLVAGQATKQAKKLAKGLRSSAVGGVDKAKGTAYDFMHNKIANDVIEGAFHLGTASAVSSWTHGVDAMLSSAMHGAAFGSVFRGIGNFLKSGVKGEQAMGENIVGSIAGSLFQGLPATARGATTKEQIYEYVMGAYFGFKESPYYSRTGQKYGAELTKTATEKHWPAEKLQEKVAEDLVKRNWDSKERQEVREVADAVIQREQVMAILRDLIKKDPTLESKLDAIGVKMTPQGELQANPDTVPKITNPKFLLEAKNKTKPTKAEVLKEDYEDTGMVIEYDGVSSSVKSQAEKTLSHTWKKKNQPEDLFLKKDKVEKLQNKLNEMVLKKSEDVEELADWLKKEYDYNIKGPEHVEDRAFYTNYLVRRNNMKPIKTSSPHIVIKYNKGMSGTGKWYQNYKNMDIVVEELSPEMPVNRANNNKAVDSPILFVEQVYARELAKRNKIIDLEDSSQRPIERVDSFTMIGNPHGNYAKEYKPSQLKELITRDVADNIRRKLRTKGDKKLSQREIDGKISRGVERELNKFVGEVTKAYEQKGMHYLSGRGDGDLSYYIKYHPVVAKVDKLGLNRKYGQVKKLLKKAGVPKVDTYLKEEMDMYVSKYGDVLGQAKAKEMFKRAYVSNHMWEMANNGLRPRRILEGKDPAIQFTEGFIGNAIAFNKRQQVWLTNGVPLNDSFLTGKIADLSVDANGQVVARTVLTRLPKSDKKPWERDALDQTEHFDGGTPVRTDVVDAINESVGHPIESGVTKNFIVSPDAKHGALLYKHMMFDAGEAQSKLMSNRELADGEKGFHFFSPETSTKQIGEGRESYFVQKEKNGDFIFIDKNGVIVDKPKAYNVPLRDMRTVLSEKTSDHNIGATRMPKQLGTNLLSTLYHSKGTSPVTKEVIDGWFKDFHLSHFNGTERGNQILEAYKNEPTPENLEKALNNMDSISTKEVVKLIVEPGYEEFSAKAYDKIARLVREEANNSRIEAEEGNYEAQELVREMDQFKSVVDRNLGLSEAGDLGVYLHKMSDPYRQKILRSYIVNNITRPKLENGMTARMTVYDWELQERFPELMNNKENYYLGDSMKAKPISSIMQRSAIKNKSGDVVEGYDGIINRMRDDGVPSSHINKMKQIKTLGELWDYKNTTNHKKVLKHIDDFFQGINVRVPMDSGSGAHVLKFGGFMGRKGYNVLMHPESMKALGGADSDGDKAFIFFDMKPQYRDAFNNAKNEFVEYQHKTNKKVKLTKLQHEKVKNPDDYYEVVSDNKKEYKKMFTVEGMNPNTGKEYTKQELADFKERNGNRALMYSPMHRYNQSQGAAGGRNNLGPAVVARQVLGATHASMIDSGTKTYYFEVGKKGEEVGYEVTAKTAEKELAEARKVARASIAFPSDPLDEIGLVHRDVAFKHVFESFFKINNAETGKAVKDPKIMRASMNQIFANINSAFFGKDQGSGKQWTYEQMKEKAMQIENLPEGGRNSILAKIAETVHPMDWRDNLAERMNFEALDKMYQAHKELLKKDIGDTGFDSYNLARLFNRSGFPVSKNWEIRKLEDGTFKRDLLDGDATDYYRAIEFLSNDIHNMVAFKRGVNHWAKTAEADPQKLRDIRNFVDKIYAMTYQNSVDGRVPVNTTVKVKGIQMNLKPSELLTLENSGNKFEIIKEEFRDNNVQKEGQQTVDAMIKEFKEGLNSNDQKSLDWYLVSGFRVPSEKSIKRWREIKDGPETAEKNLLNRLVHYSGQTRFAFASPEVNDSVIKQFWKDYAQTFKGLKKPKQESVNKDIDGARNMMEKGEGVISGEKAILEVDGMNPASPTPSISEALKNASSYKKVLGDLDAFKRISEKENLPELSSESKSVRDRLQKALERHQAHIGGNLELFIRGEFNKEADQMTMLELKSLTNMLESPGTWFQENRAKFHINTKTGKPDAPMVSKWVHMMFPRSIDRLWLSKEMKMIETAVPAWHRNKEGEWTMDFVKGNKPMHRQGQLQYQVSNNQRISTDQQTIEENRVLASDHAKENLSWLASIPKADILHEYAIMRLEKATGAEHAAKGREGAGAAEAYRYYELVNPKSDLSIAMNKIAKEKFKAIFDKDPVEISGEEVMSRIEKFWRKKSDSDYKFWIQGKKEHIDKYFYLDKNGVEHAKVEDFIRDVQQALTNGQKPHEVIQIGNDHMNKMATHVQIRNEKNKEFKQALSQRLKHFETPYRKNYWHHTRFDEAELKKALDMAIERVKTTPAKNQKKREQLVAQAARLAFQLKNITGEINLDSFNNWSMYEMVKSEINNKIQEKESLSGLSSMFKHSSQNARTLNVKGWDRSPQAGIDYAKGQVETFYNNLSQIMGRETIRKFEADQVKKYKKNGKVIDKAGWENAKAWKNIFEMYLNESMGFPSVIPEHVLNNPNMKLKGTPYAWWSDSNVKNRLNKIANAMGVKKDKEILGELGQYMDYNKLRSWTNMEAKYQLATLLAHPKTAIANVFGGSTLTIQSTGLRHWRNARNHQYLRDNIDPSFTTKEDAGRWVESLGVIEQFLRYELGLNPSMKNRRVKEGVDKIFKKLKKDPNMDDVTLKQAWKETGLTNDLFNKAAVFMRKSERLLRRDSFLAHYLQAKDMFGDAISGKGSRDHPFLIEWARRGVQDTQFLYTAAFRPAFARSALGKVMTRFQLWAWNSVAFRNKVLKEAKMYGFEEGTPQFERFKRTASIDLMVFGLANAFAYSLFEANLPAPYSWMQDTADWLFGDEKTRDRAFFGAYPNQLAPLQMITPPAARLVGPTMKAMIDDDWGKFGNYYAWTMFPFGRLARDVKNSVQNPIRTVENMTGVPYIGIHRYLKNTRQIGEEDVPSDE